MYIYQEAQINDLPPSAVQYSWLHSPFTTIFSTVTTYDMNFWTFLWCWSQECGDGTLN